MNLCGRLNWNYNAWDSQIIIHVEALNYWRTDFEYQNIFKLFVEKRHFGEHIVKSAIPHGKLEVQNVPVSNKMESGYMFFKCHVFRDIIIVLMDYHVVKTTNLITLSGSDVELDFRNATMHCLEVLECLKLCWGTYGPSMDCTETTA